MTKAKRPLHRKIFPTAHKKTLWKRLYKHFHQLTGDILVIGAGNEPYRKLLKASKNICLTDIEDKSGDIDQIADAHDLPFIEDTFDAVVAIEVFEHLQQPSVASSEILRVLRPSGQALVTIPFMFRIHGDPFDFQRFTARGLIELFCDFSNVKVIEFGGRHHVISDIITTTTPAFAAFRIFNHLLILSFLGNSMSIDCPSGYIVTLVK